MTDEDYQNELAVWKQIAGISISVVQGTEEQRHPKVGTPEWFNRPVDTSRFPSGFRGRVKKR